MLGIFDLFQASLICVFDLCQASFICFRLLWFVFWYMLGIFDLCLQSISGIFDLCLWSMLAFLKWIELEKCWKMDHGIEVCLIGTENYWDEVNKFIMIGIILVIASSALDKLFLTYWSLYPCMFINLNILNCTQ